MINSYCLSTFNNGRWCSQIIWSAALIIKNKDHLKQDGIGMNKILLLKKNSTDMNKGKNNHGHE